jgi:hypothetical protein
MIGWSGLMHWSSTFIRIRYASAGHGLLKVEANPAFEGAKMRKQWIVVAAAITVVSLCAVGAAAQGPGPQGAGAAEATQNSHAPRSYNPMKFMKKGSNTATENPKKAKNKKPSAKRATPDTPAPPPKS